MKHVFGGFFQAQTGFAYGSKTVTVPIVVVRTTKEEAIGWCMEEGRRQFPVPEYFGHSPDTTTTTEYGIIDGQTHCAYNND
jgi:hypothetical protein